MLNETLANIMSIIKLRQMKKMT